MSIAHQASLHSHGELQGLPALKMNPSYSQAYPKKSLGNFFKTVYSFILQICRVRLLCAVLGPGDTVVSKPFLFLVPANKQWNPRILNMWPLCTVCTCACLTRKLITYHFAPLKHFTLPRVDRIIIRLFPTQENQLKNTWNVWKYMI